MKNIKDIASGNKFVQWESLAGPIDENFAELNEYKLSKNGLAQTTGNSTTNAMSQGAVTKELEKRKEYEEYTRKALTGQAETATANDYPFVRIDIENSDGSGWNTLNEKLNDINTIATPKYNGWVRYFLSGQAIDVVNRVLFFGNKTTSQVATGPLVISNGKLAYSGDADKSFARIYKGSSWSPWAPVNSGDPGISSSFYKTPLDLEAVDEGSPLSSSDMEKILLMQDALNKGQTVISSVGVLNASIVFRRPSYIINISYIKGNEMRILSATAPREGGTWHAQNIDLSSISSGGGSVDIVQTTGSSTSSVMSQKAVTDALNKKQDTLVSGTNIKTINGQPIVGPGNIEISGTGGGIADAPDTSNYSYNRVKGNWVADTYYIPGNLGSITEYNYYNADLNTILGDKSAFITAMNTSVPIAARIYSEDSVTYDSYIRLNYKRNKSAGDLEISWIIGSILKIITIPYVEGSWGNISSYKEYDFSWGKVGKLTSSNQAEIFNNYNQNQATASNAHAEGSGTKANGFCSHAEGFNTETNNDYEHASGAFNKSNEGSLSSEKTIFSVGIGENAITRKNAYEVMHNGDMYVLGVGGYDGTNPSTSTTLQKYINESTGGISDAPSNGKTYGRKNEDWVETLPLPARQSDYNYILSGTDLIWLNLCLFKGSYRNSIILNNRQNQASGDQSIAMNTATSAKGSASASFGAGSIAEASYSLSAGHYTVADNYAQFSIGSGNIKDPSASPTNYNVEKRGFVLGNGRTDYYGREEEGDAFRVFFNGKVESDMNYSTPAADYAEMFEWKDGNMSNEDRVGLFVTLDGENIALANAESKYILGVVSAVPAVLGDSPIQWYGKYLNDEWGRPIYEDVEYTEVKDLIKEDGSIEKVKEKKTAHVRKMNPNYDGDMEYKPRAERQEWDAIGMLGKLMVKHDGTLVQGGFCKPSAGGIATNSESGYYVMKVVNDYQALILFR